MGLYLIKRGPKPDYHRAPFHPVIVCDRKPIARWEAGWTGDQAWVWSKYGAGPDEAYSGWLLERWQGLDIDYGHLVRGVTLPDGEHGAFHHPGARADTWGLLKSATWWSSRKIPEWLVERGVVNATDEFSLDRIAELERDRDLAAMTRRS